MSTYTATSAYSFRWTYHGDRRELLPVRLDKRVRKGGLVRDDKRRVVRVHPDSDLRDIIRTCPNVQFTLQHIVTGEACVPSKVAPIPSEEADHAE